VGRQNFGFLRAGVSIHRQASLILALPLQPGRWVFRKPHRMSGK
jgi:hypothetical protein